MMIKFNLSISTDSVSVCKQDSLFVCGSSKFLGEWDLNEAIEMKLKHNEDNWSLCSGTSNSSFTSTEKVPDSQ